MIVEEWEEGLMCNRWWRTLSFLKKGVVMLPRRQLYFIVSYSSIHVLQYSTHTHVRHSPWDPRPAALQLHNNNTPRPPSEKPKDCAPGTTRGPLLCLGLALGLVFVRAVEKAAALHVGHTRRRYLLLLLDTGEVLVVKENHEQDKVGGVHDEAQLPVGRIDKAIVTTHLHPCCG